MSRALAGALALWAAGCFSYHQDTPHEGPPLHEVARFPDDAPTGLAISRTGRIFVNFPRWSVVEILKDGQLRPYPDERWNTWPGPSTGASRPGAIPISCSRCRTADTLRSHAVRPSGGARMQIACPSCGQGQDLASFRLAAPPLCEGCRSPLSPEIDPLRRSPRLRVIQGGQTGEEFIFADEIVIGRYFRLPVVIHDPQVSRKHLALAPYGYDALRLTDQRSTNGSYVNGTAVQQAIVRHGDRLTVGETVLLVCLPAVAGPVVFTAPMTPAAPAPPPTPKAQETQKLAIGAIAAAAAARTAPSAESRAFEAFFAIESDSPQRGRMWAAHLTALSHDMMVLRTDIAGGQAVREGDRIRVMILGQKNLPTMLDLAGLVVGATPLQTEGTVRYVVRARLQGVDDALRIALDRAVAAIA